MASESNPTAPPQPMSLSERFFRYFQHEVTALQEQMDRLADTALAGGERDDAVDHCLAGIARLSHEVKDASTYIPAYDQRTYAEAIKALSEKLQTTRASLAPRPKFTFKTRKNPSAISLNDAAELASQQKLRLPGYSSNESSLATTPAHLRSPEPEPPEQSPPEEPTAESQESDLINKHLREVHAQDGQRIRKPSFSRATSVVLSNQRGLHIILPASASHATTSGTLKDLRGCIVDLSVPTSSSASGRPFAGLTLRNIRDSLVICGAVAGPAHVTAVTGSVVLAACRQFRMHACRDTVVYLHCASRPIVEDCEQIRFAPLPNLYIPPSHLQSLQNNWDKVDDFNWLRPEPSPHWSLLPDADRTPDEIWQKVVPGGPGLGVEDILKAIKGDAAV